MFSPIAFSRNRQSSPPWMLILLGMIVGKSDYSSLIIEWFEEKADSFLIPAYTLAVILYLTALAFRKQLEPLLPPLLALFRKKKAVVPELPPVTELLPPEHEEPQPIDLSGAYKLVSNDNFEGFLEVQGVPWALRRAANQARPVHRIFHRGCQLTIKIEGIIESQTSYVIGGPPVETNVRGRIFEDVVSYNDTETGILVRKKAITEDYDVTVERQLSDCQQRITMTSTAFFRDGRDSVQCQQIFERCE